MAVLKPHAKLRGLMLAQGMGKNEILERFLSSVCWAPCEAVFQNTENTARADQTLLHP